MISIPPPKVNGSEARPTNIAAGGATANRWPMPNRGDCVGSKLARPVVW